MPILIGYDAEGRENQVIKEIEINEAELQRWIEGVLREVMPAYVLPTENQSPARPDSLDYFHPAGALIQWTKIRGFDQLPPVGLTMDSQFLLYCIDALREGKFEDLVEYRIIAAGMAVNDIVTKRYQELRGSQTNPRDLRVAKRQLIRSCYMLETLLTNSGLQEIQRLHPIVTTQELPFLQLVEYLESHLEEISKPKSIFLTNPIDFPSRSLEVERLNRSQIDSIIGNFDPRLFYLLMKIIEILLFNSFHSNRVIITDAEVLQMCKNMLPELNNEAQGELSRCIVQVISNPEFTVFFAPGSIKVATTEAFE